MSVYGYARCSSLSQSTAIQEELLKQAGCSVVRSEKVSGGTTEGREALQTLLDFIQAEDTLVVTRLDRLGRSTRDVLNPSSHPGATLQLASGARTVRYAHRHYQCGADPES